MKSKRNGLILLVEDEVLVGMMLKKKIQAHGYDTSEIITTGEEAVSCALRDKPDLLFMDVALPGKIDGVEAARQIKEKLDIPVIFLQVITGISSSLSDQKSSHQLLYSINLAVLKPLFGLCNPLLAQLTDQFILHFLFF